MNATAVVRTIPEQPKSVLVRLADRFGVDPDKMLSTLRATAFRGDATNEQLMALCIVAEQYGLNPWTKEIYAFPGGRGEIVPVVGVDGWARIINSNPNFDGMDFKEGEPDKDGIPAWIECSIHRKDRSHPTTTREYFVEVRRDSAAPWRSHPRRMLRHKAVIQCARLAFGFAGIYDPDEAERIIEVQPITTANPRGDLSNVDTSMRDKHVSAITDILNMDKEEAEIAQLLRDYEAEYLQPFHEMYISVLDELAAKKIIAKGKFREYIKIGLDRK